MFYCAFLLLLRTLKSITLSHLSTTYTHTYTPAWALHFCLDTSFLYRTTTSSSPFTSFCPYPLLFPSFFLFSSHTIHLESRPNTLQNDHTTDQWQRVFLFICADTVWFYFPSVVVLYVIETKQHTKSPREGTLHQLCKESFATIWINGIVNLLSIHMLFRPECTRKIRRGTCIVSPS